MEAWVQQRFLFALLATAMVTASAGVFAGVLLAGPRRHFRGVIPLSAGVLLGVALFGLLPELARDLSWGVSLLIFAAGFLTLTGLDRMGVSICPDCSHDHDHDGCPAPLHGFAAPLLIAAGVHSLFDGWAIAATGASASGGVRIALPLALVLHKLPEGFSLGAILRHSLRSRASALSLGILAEGLTLVGGAIAMELAPRLGSGWTTYPLALAADFSCFWRSCAAWRVETESGNGDGDGGDRVGDLSGFADGVAGVFGRLAGVG